MKLLEQLESLMEQASFGKIQREIYDYVLTKLKVSADIRSSLDEISRSTDQFWVSEFDDVSHEFKDGEISTIEDVIANAMQAVAYEMQQYLGNSMNHEPGAKTVKINVDNLDYDAIPSKDIKGIIDKIDPTLIAKQKELERVEAEERKAASKAAIKAITKERLTELVAFVKKYEKAGWKIMAVEAKRKNPDLPAGIDKDQLDGVKTPEEVRARFKEHMSDDQFIAAIFQGAEWAADDAKDESRWLDVSALWVVARNAGLRNKFKSMYGAL